MIPTDLKNHSRFSWYYKTKIRNWLWSITRVNPIAWCGNPEGLGTALQFLQDDSRLSLIVQNSGSKARVFLTNGLERAMKLKSDRFWKSGLWKKKEVLETTKGVVYLSSLDNFIYSLGTKQAYRYQRTENKSTLLALSTKLSKVWVRPLIIFGGKVNSYIHDGKRTK